MDVSLHVSEMLLSATVGRWCRFQRVVAGTALLSVCIAIPVSARALASIASPETTCLINAEPRGAPVFLAQRDETTASSDAAVKDADPDGHNASIPDSQPMPAESESDQLKTFTPSETIDADQGVDFPYDI